MTVGPKMKRAMMVVGVLLVPVAAFFAFSELMFGDTFRQERDAIRYAENADGARLAKLITDCRAVASGRPLVPEPKQQYPDCYACMWDSKTGYPEEFRDFRPLAAFVGPDAITLITFKAFDHSVAIDIKDLRSPSPRISMRHGDTFRPKTKELWPKKPNT